MPTLRLDSNPVTDALIVLFERESTRSRKLCDAVIGILEASDDEQQAAIDALRRTAKEITTTER